MFGLHEMAFASLTGGEVIMIVLGGLLIYLGIAKNFEPLLLVPIGFGMILVNIPLGGLMIYSPDGFPAESTTLVQLLQDIGNGKVGLLNILFAYGIKTEIIPLLIFVGLGALIDFSPTIARPISLFFGATAQLGVFVAFSVAYLSGFTPNEAACIGIIGGSDGPPTVYLTVALAPQLLGPIALVAYSYMALVPIIQPPVIRLLTTKKERAMYMNPKVREVSRLELILFPVVIFIVAALFVPKCVPIIGMLMFGNLLRVTGVTDRLAQSAGTVFIDVLTFLLALTVGGLMTADVFLRAQTLAIIGLAALAFIFSTVGGVLGAKLVNLFLKEKINPMIGAAGVSAVPMSARIVQKMGQEANPRNFLLMHAMGPNTAGVISTAVVTGILYGMLMK
jgi:carboxybiotin decarboxylase